MSTRILLVDDDHLLRCSLEYRLSQEGYAVTACETGAQAVQNALADPPELVLLDIGLPDRDGLEVARALQRRLTVPIIFLTARSQEDDIIAGLELGAEDYVAKPFRVRELLARIQVVLRRRRLPRDAGDDMLQVGDVRVDVLHRQVSVAGAPVELPPKQFSLLCLLVSNAGTPLATSYLLDTIWGPQYAGAQQLLYVHINCLRDRIERDPSQPVHIQTVRGVGYRFAIPERPA